MSGELPSGAVGRGAARRGCGRSSPRSSIRWRAGSGTRPSSRRRWCWSSCGAHGAHRGGLAGAATCWRRTDSGDGGRGDVRPARGGFARYAVDRGWVVPHFEKMLYDNAQLVGLYARLGTEAGDRVARETADFMIRELRHPGGRVRLGARCRQPRPGDRQSVEGAFYAWTPAQLVEVLGEEHGAWAADLFSVTEAGTFEHGMSTLQLRHYPATDLDRTRLAHVQAPTPRGPRRAPAARASTTRSSRPGTGWPSAASATPGCSSASRSTSTPLSPRASSWRASTWSRQARPATCRSCASPATAWRVRTRGCSRTTAAWRPASCRSSRPPATRSGSTLATELLDHALAGFRAARRRLLRHPRRRRGPGGPPARPRRQRVAERVQQHGPRPGDRPRAHGRGPLPRRCRGGAGHGRGARRAGAPLRRLVACRGPHHARRAARGRGRRPRRPGPRRPRRPRAPAPRRSRGGGRRAARRRTPADRTHRSGRPRGGVRLPWLRLRAAGDLAGRPP